MQMPSDVIRPVAIFAARATTAGPALGQVRSWADDHLVRADAFPATILPEQQAREYGITIEIEFEDCLEIGAQR